MKSSGIISLNRRQTPKGLIQAHHYTTNQPSPSFLPTIINPNPLANPNAYSMPITESIGLYPLNKNLTRPSSKLHPNTISFNPVSYTSHYDSNTPSNDIIYNNLHPSYGQPSQLIPDHPRLETSSTFFQPHLNNNNEHPEVDKESFEDFIGIFGVPESNGMSSDGQIRLPHREHTMNFREKLGFISKEFDIPIHDDTNPTLEDILDGTRVPTISMVAASNFNKSYQSSVTPRHLDANLSSSTPQQLPRDTAPSHKQRIRWTTELHDLFINAVTSLGGPEVATPKRILGIMKVDGLNIYHVKSHLQKYRLHKHIPELKQEKRASTSTTEKKMASTLINDNDKRIKSDIQVTDTLHIQIEVQKLLHEQLKAQRELQMRIEQNGEFLKKLMEQQMKVIDSEDPYAYVIGSNSTEQLSNLLSKDVAFSSTLVESPIQLPNDVPKSMESRISHKRSTE